MVVRVAGLAYQKGFGGHFHNDNSLAVLRDIPGVILAVPSHPAEAPGLLRTCFDLARHDGRVCVFLEPIALYHTRDLKHEGDGAWTAPYRPPHAPEPATPLGEIARHGSGEDVLLVTFGTGRGRRALGRVAPAVREGRIRWWYFLAGCVGLLHRPGMISLGSTALATVLIAYTCVVLAAHVRRTRQASRSPLPISRAALPRPRPP